MAAHSGAPLTHIPHLSLCHRGNLREASIHQAREARSPLAQGQLGSPNDTQRSYIEAVSGLAQTLPCQMAVQMLFPIQAKTPAWLSTQHKAYTKYQHASTPAHRGTLRDRKQVEELSLSSRKTFVFIKILRRVICFY